MIAKSAHLLIEELLDEFRTGGDADFAAFVHRNAIEDPEVLADIINADGRERMRRGHPVDLQLYLDAVTGLRLHAVALDTAIEIVLLSMHESGASGEEAIDTLIANYPDLEDDIRTAAMLNDVICSTSQVERVFVPHLKRTLPQDFGPDLSDGRCRYELREVLGTGSHGTVYLAVDRRLSEPDRPAWVAIKLLVQPASEDRQRDLLMEEATKARRVEHPNVVRVLDVGTTAEEDYIVYEHVSGGTLEASFHELTGHARTRAVVAAIAEISQGLQAAHSAGLVHRDLKPANVLIDSDGRPKITDFGIAWSAGTRQREGTDSPGTLRGNLAFIAPEQYRMEPGAEAPAADVYALGGLLYWGLTGELPNGRNPEEIGESFDRLREGAPPVRRPAIEFGIDDDLAAICERALAGTPRLRYGSAELLAADLQAWLEHRPIHWTNPAVPRQIRLFVRREPVAAGLLVAFIAVLVLGSFGVSTLRSAIDTERVAKEAAENLAEQQEQANATIGQIMSYASQYMTRARAGSAPESEWLPFMTAYESVFGPIVLPDFTRVNAEWADRIEFVAATLSDLEASGEDDSIGSLMWSTALAFWCLHADRTSETVAIVDDLSARFAPRLAEDDPWRSHLAALRDCAVARELTRDVAETPLSDAHRAELDEIADRLRAVEQRIGGFDSLGALHRLVVNTLARIYGRAVLDRPRDLLWAQDRLADFGALSPTS
jgi:serine/threonine protein kinase